MCQFKRSGFAGLLCALAMVACVGPLAAQVNPDLFSGMKWRQIGPFRGGRVVAVTGVPGDSATWYFGAVAGGVWKTSNAGNSWQPVFDDQKIASIGAIAVADSDHNVIYVGTGEACPRGNITYGNGVYKSLDAGKTWQHVGLVDTRHIGAIIVHPQTQTSHLSRRSGTPSDRTRSEEFSARLMVEDLATRTISRSGHGRDRCRFRSAQSKHVVRVSVADAAAAMGFFERRPRVRPVSLQRRRSSLEADRRAWPSAGPPGPHWRFSLGS